MQAGPVKAPTTPVPFLMQPDIHGNIPIRLIVVFSFGGVTYTKRLKVMAYPGSDIPSHIHPLIREQAHSIFAEGAIYKSRDDLECERHLTSGDLLEWVRSMIVSTADSAH